MTDGKQITTYDKVWAEQAERSAAQEQLVSGAVLSARGGTLQVGEEVLPGNQACVIVLDSVFENTYYEGKFDPDNPMPPVCYAFGRGVDGQEEMAPHESMQSDLSYFKPQHDSCKGCPKNEWGSADQGRGKACQNRRRLALIPAGYYQAKRGSRDFDLQIFDDPKHFQTADIVMAKLPVMSVKNWSKYVNQIATNFHRPPHGVITRISLVPDPQSQFRFEFELIEELPDELAQVIMDRHDAAVKQAFQGYKPPQERAPKVAGSRNFRRT